MERRRTANVIPYIGEAKKTFGGDALPTILEVLKVYFFRHTIEGVSQRESVKTVTEEVCEIWKKVIIPIQAEKNVARKLMMQLNIYRNLCRNKKRGGPSQVVREANFVKSIENLFDISRQKALDMMDDDDYKIFLLDQRGERTYRISILQQIRAKKMQEKIDKFITEKANFKMKQQLSMNTEQLTC